jgi:hypothetical protein
MVPGVSHAPYPNCYRCPYGPAPESCAVECVKNEWLDDMGFAVISLPANRGFKITNRVRSTDEVTNRQVKNEWRGDREYTD